MKKRQMEANCIFIHDQPYPLYYWIISLTIILLLVGFLVYSERRKKRPDQEEEAD